MLKLNKDDYLKVLSTILPASNVGISNNNGVIRKRKSPTGFVNLGQGALFNKGAAHADKFVASRYDNEDYIAGYKESEHPVVTLTITGEAPKYSYCDAKYDGVDEWHYSKESALNAAYLSRNPMLLFISKLQTFDGFVSRDAVIKPDVERIYQQSIDGGVQCSINGKFWWDGGVMDCPLIPIVRVFSERATISHNQWRCGYLEIKATPELLMKGSLTKLKPEKPKEPAYFYGEAWYERHLRFHKECYWAIKCQHYYDAEKKFDSDTKKYQQAIQKWRDL